MNNLIVVFGSVTSKQYKQATLWMLRDGLKPKIVRLDKDARFRRNYDLWDEVNRRRGTDYDYDGELSLEEMDEAVSGRISQLVDEMLIEAFGSLEGVSRVGTVVLPESPNTLPEWDWATNRFGRYDEFMVTTDSYSGHTYLVGR